MREKAKKVDVINKTKGKLPRLPFQHMKDYVLGKNYELSVAFIGDSESQKLNKTWRDKDKPTNILSFSLSKEEGEIFINQKFASKEAPLFGRTASNFIAFLFIHGLFHLKGMDHGSTMESKERNARKKFGI